MLVILVWMALTVWMEARVPKERQVVRGKRETKETMEMMVFPAFPAVLARKGTKENVVKWGMQEQTVRRAKKVKRVTKVTRANKDSKVLPGALEVMV